MTMAMRRWTVAVGALAALLLVACGTGDRTGFSVPVNAEAIATAGSASLPADLEWANLEAGNVVFSHGVHMVFADNCDVCHKDNQPWGMGKSAHGTIQMAPMYEGQSCGVCHDGTEAFAATSCTRCHDLDSVTAPLPDIQQPGGGFGPTTFSHNMHLMAGATCENCHPEPWRWTVSEPGAMQMGPMYVGASCGVCHDGRQAFDATECARCHDRGMARDVGTQPDDIEWPGTEEYARVVFSHVTHAQSGKTCDACHDGLFEYTTSPAGAFPMVPMYAGRTCGTCHDGGEAFPATDCAACHEGASNPVDAAAAAEIAAAASAPAED